MEWRYTVEKRSTAADKPSKKPPGSGLWIPRNTQKTQSASLVLDAEGCDGAKRPASSRRGVLLPSKSPSPLPTVHRPQLAVSTPPGGESLHVFPVRIPVDDARARLAPPAFHLTNGQGTGLI